MSLGKSEESKNKRSEKSEKSETGHGRHCIVYTESLRHNAEIPFFYFLTLNTQTDLFNLILLFLSLSNVSDSLTNHPSETSECM